MRLAIEATLDYEFSGPTDVLMAVEAATMADQRIVAFGTPEEVRRVEHPFISSFFGGAAAAPGPAAHAPL